MRSSRLALLVVVAALAGWGTATGQAPPTGSRYLPVEHWAYEYVGRLQDRAYLSELNPLVQPYRRMDVARGLASLDPDTLRQPIAEWVRLLKRELAPELDRLAGRPARTFGFETMAGTHASTGLRLDPTRPVGSGKAWPWYRGGAWVETGPVAAESRLYGDRYFKDDPDGSDPGFDPLKSLGGRTDNAYLSVLFPLGSVDLGVLKRNWGVVGTPGMGISDVATPYPQIGLELHSGRVALRAFAAELDVVNGEKRQMIVHRVDYHHGDLTVGLGETLLYVYPTILLRFLNPLDEFLLGNDDNPVQNSTIVGQVWWRHRGSVVYLDGLLDDIWLFPGDVVPLPPRYGFTLGARLVSLAPWIALGTEYQQVGAWTYRTSEGTDRLTYLGRGLGANYSDYDRLAVRADLYPPARGLRLSPGILVQRQGEGNLRDSIPNGGQFAGQRTLFLGVKETTWRLALAGRYQPVPFVWFAWDAGPNFVRNKAHVAGARKTEFEATGEIGLKIDFPR